MRNNILHQNASPSLTTPMVRNFKEEFQLFAQELETHLNNELLRISKICLPEEEITHDTPVEE